MLQSAKPLHPHPVLVALAGGLSLASLMGFGRFFYTPVLPAMMADLHLDPAQSGLIAAANFAGYLAGAVLAAYGWAAGRERSLALAALAANAVLLAAMGLVSTIPAFVVIRFLAGLASALGMVFTSAIVLSHGLAAGDRRVPVVYFSGVGAGIALSSLLVMGLASLHPTGLAGWRLDWFVAAGFAALAVLAIGPFLPRGGRGGPARPEPPLLWRRPLVALTLSYGLFGIGYVVTATFIVAMAREGGGGRLLEGLTWFLTGLTAMLSLFAWKGLDRTLGILGVYRAALVIEAAGVAATVLLPPPASVLVGGFLLGATFMVVTAYGLQLGRTMAPESPRRSLAMMTAGFGVGQIVGPLAAGWLAGLSGGYGLPSLLAAVVLAIAALATLAAGDHAMIK
ncbi:YbfB/YjiJ family MFS transporter [Mycoplana sp. MJR14]|uniref:YbfB/YjiJ family MFS transporter n=1 Tax=Mycoplana sp. MJR14 TaxID=3032583 RepID=UPI0023DC4535|nr:YbfB/YjiJ family MFS transporter [Mycoplana sp. MJR14]MDF1634768.1 YbfB/YjiJ family MFS transporter [Mycoplana sp. MJR14]